MLHHRFVDVAQIVLCKYTIPGRQGRQKIILQKNAEKINKFIKYFVEINKNEVNKKM
jgi:hypothetical protein